jgi:hypothetical protein
LLFLIVSLSTSKGRDPKKPLIIISGFFCEAA